MLDWQATAHRAHVPKMLFTNADAAAPNTQFGRTRDQLASLVRVLFSPATANEHLAESREAEFLVQGFFPLRRMTSIAVPDEPAAARIRGILGTYSSSMTVIVRPEWFSLN